MWDLGLIRILHSTIDSRLFTLLKITFTGTSVYDVHHVHLVIEHLHHLSLCFYHAIVDDFDSLHITLKKGRESN